MKRRTFLGSAAMTGVAATIDTAATATAAAASRSAIGPALDKAMIWCADNAAAVAFGPAPAAGQQSFLQRQGEGGDLHVAFIREFTLDTAPTRADFHLFTFTRYRLYVNGAYVGRGPARFENLWPEYDSWDVAANLKPGRNVIAILAHRDAPTGRIMKHAPGLAAMLAYAGRDGVERRIVSDASWRARPERSFSLRDNAWSSIPERIDARRSDDWTAGDYDSSGWPRAIRADAKGFAPLQPRSIPHMRETVLPFKNAKLPARLDAGERLNLVLDGVSLVYHRLTFEATAGSEIEIAYALPENNLSGINRYIAREGRQVYEGGDVFAANRIVIRVFSGSVTLTDAQAIEVLYPFERVGRFDTDDRFLNSLWTLCARSLELMSEDSYTDCADRERVEWMDCSPPAYDVTQVMMAAPDGKGGMRYSDPRLLQGMLRRTALTAQRDGMLKAHTCSERWDLHAIMEDRACAWAIGLRQYYDVTGDKDFVREMWPAMVGLLNWFDVRRTSRGLFQGREWEVWGNPLCYQVCEGAGLNAFYYRAMTEAVFLGRQIGRTAQAQVFADRAAALKTAFNDLLWDEAQGAYLGALFGPTSKRATDFNMKITDAEIAGGRFRPTLHAALYAFYADLVPPERRARLTDWMLANDDNIVGVMTHQYLFERYYALDRPELDTEVLRRMRTGWREMVESPWGTSWETLNGGGASKAHIYGMVPGQYLGAYVLGVRPDGPTAGGKLLIDPRPGDLKRADGVVSSAFGPVPIRWTRADGGAMDLTVTVPQGAKAEVRLRALAGAARVEVNGRPAATKMAKDRVVVALGAGQHRVRQVG